MNITIDACNFTQVVTSGTGVIGGLTGKPIYLQGICVGNRSAQAIALYSGSTAVTMCQVTLAANNYHIFPLAAPGGITYQTLGNPGDADLRLVFFWVPGQQT